MLDILQTIGICVGALALVVIAIAAFVVSSTVSMLTAPLNDDELDDDELTVDDVRRIAEQEFSGPGRPVRNPRKK